MRAKATILDYFNFFFIQFYQLTHCACLTGCKLLKKKTVNISNYIIYNWISNITVSINERRCLLSTSWSKQNLLTNNFYSCDKHNLDKQVLKTLEGNGFLTVISNFNKGKLKRTTKLITILTRPTRG